MASNRQKKKSAPKRKLYSQSSSPGHIYAPDWVIVALAVVGLITAVIGWFSIGTPLCPTDSGCDQFRSSHWASAFGIPVLFWALLLHGLVGLVAWQTPPNLKRWRRLTSLALIGIAVALYLGLAALIVVGALCPWCLGTFLISAILFVTLLYRRPHSAPGMRWFHWALQSLGVIVVAMFILHLLNAPQMNDEPSSRLEALAIHLEKTGARYYGAHWCATCQEQNELFADAADELPYIECSTNGQGSPMTLTCAQRDIRSYPTWIINGQRYERVLEPEELAEHTGFEWEPE